MNDEVIKALFNTPTMTESTVLKMFGPQAALLMLLYKLDVIGARRVSHPYGSILSSGFSYTAPPCSIPLAVISLGREYIQFCPKRMADPDLKI